MTSRARFSTITELLDAPDRLQGGGAPEVDALIEKKALAECALLAVDLDAMSGTARLLFDCRWRVPRRECPWR